MKTNLDYDPSVKFNHYASLALNTGGNHVDNKADLVMQTDYH